MTQLHTLKDTSRPRKNSKRVGRGIGSGKGKTCGRGEKGAGSRSGYKRRWGKEGGNMPLYMKVPARGFNNARFQQRLDVINLEQIDAAFSDGEVVNLDSLRARGFLSGPSYGIKVLGKGDLTKKISLDVAAISSSAKEKLQKAKIPFKLSEK